MAILVTIKHSMQLRLSDPWRPSYPGGWSTARPYPSNVGESGSGGTDALLSFCDMANGINRSFRIISPTWSFIHCQLVLPHHFHTPCQLDLSLGVPLGQRARLQLHL